MIFTVAIYHTDLAYGGPEEGGWYYERGELWNNKDLDPPFRVRRFLFRKSAYRHQAKLYEQLELTRDDQMRACVNRGWNPPEYYPQERPHYE